jgi:hypothetical protein
MLLNELKPIALAAFVNKVAMELQSGPGVGKTSWMYQFRDQLEKQLRQPIGLKVEHLATLDPMDLRGIPYRDAASNSMKFTPPSFWPTEADFPDGKIPRFGIILFDERGQASQDAIKATARMMEERRMGAYNLDDLGHWVVWAASNRLTDRSGVNKPLMFDMNRKMTIQVDPALEPWVEWAELNGVHPDGILFAKWRPSTVFNSEVPKEDVPFCTPRSYVRSLLMMQSLSDDGRLATDKNAAEAAAGLMGSSATSELLGYIKMANDLVTLEQIMADPTGTKLPTRSDATHAISERIGAAMDENNAAPLFEYLKRLPMEFQVTVVRNMTRRRTNAGLPDLMSLGVIPNAGVWLSKNAPDLLAVSSI